jgi:hypothetical protein
MQLFPHLRRGRTAPLKLAARAAIASWVVFTGLNALAAGPAPVAAAFGNTVISTYADGSSQKIWLHPDGTWSGLSRRNSPLAGRWNLKGEKVCLRQSQPPTLPISYCTPLPPSNQPGAQWASHDAAGRSITLSLMKGMPPQYQGGPSASR